jgi:hypothetical protein
MVLPIRSTRMKAVSVGSMLPRSVLCLLLVAFLASCTGSRVEGEYACLGGLLDSIKLESGGKADVRETYLGQKIEKTATYTVDGSKVTVVLDGQSAVLTLFGKTLAGGDMLGTCTAK